MNPLNRAMKRAMPGQPDPDDAEEIADADLEALDAIAEALLDAVIQGRSDDDPPPMTTPPPNGEGINPPSSSAS
jgi:hypothetical protein